MIRNVSTAANILCEKTFGSPSCFIITLLVFYDDRTIEVDNKTDLHFTIWNMWNTLSIMHCFKLICLFYFLTSCSEIMFYYYFLKVEYLKYIFGHFTGDVKNSFCLMLFLSPSHSNICSVTLFNPWCMPFNRVYRSFKFISWLCGAFSFNSLFSAFEWLFSSIQSCNP